MQRPAPLRSRWRYFLQAVTLYWAIPFVYCDPARQYPNEAYCIVVRGGMAQRYCTECQPASARFTER